MMTVCPALWPPAYRATMEKFSERTSTILPLPSSPHWAPTITAVLPLVVLLILKSQLRCERRHKAAQRVCTHVAPASSILAKTEGVFRGPGCTDNHILPCGKRQRKPKLS